MKNCYIHIPFCEKICSYCDFCKLFYNEKFVELYLDALEREITSIYRGEKLETIYIGGGTPSSLNISQLKKLFQILDKFNKKDNIEYTIECNFENTTEEKIKLFKEYPDVESFKKDVYEKIEIGLQQAKEGMGTPAREFFKEMEEKYNL